MDRWMDLLCTIPLTKSAVCIKKKTSKCNNLDIKDILLMSWSTARRTDIHILKKNTRQRRIAGADECDGWRVEPSEPKYSHFLLISLPQHTARAPAVAPADLRSAGLTGSFQHACEKPALCRADLWPSVMLEHIGRPLCDSR